MHLKILWRSRMYTNFPGNSFVRRKKYVNSREELRLHEFLIVLCIISVFLKIKWSKSVR